GLRLTADEITYFDVTAYRINHHNEDGGQVLQLHNVTPYKKKTQELISSNKQLDQVIYKTTHDLRAPIMSALGLITLAEQSPEPQRLEYLALIRRSLNKLNTFIEEMHHFYRTGKMAIQQQLIVWEELVQEELDDQRMTYHPDKVRIEVNIHQPVDFCSDKLRVKTILTNLLTNAIKYADTRKPKHLIQINVSVTEKEAVLSVKDNGIGIEKQYQNRIFDMFFRATTQAHGSGLGLFILRDTVERLHGKIELQSEPGQGSEFIVYLPNQKCNAEALTEDTRAGSRSFS
ncbi:MAG: HAMP domain-containing histidine kinase, partial [Cyclobacteriaceae bacterium]|nr:HAMP domain-containing histidine kinase [Cyclobacteriaceae bacterium]